MKKSLFYIALASAAVFGCNNPMDVNPDVPMEERVIVYGGEGALMSVGDDEEISIISPKGTSGYMTIYTGHWADSDDEDQYYVAGDVLANVSVTDGYGYMSLKTLNKGYYSWQLGNKVGGGYDGYAGALGVKIDRIQIAPNK